MYNGHSMDMSVMTKMNIAVNGIYQNYGIRVEQADELYTLLFLK